MTAPTPNAALAYAVLDEIDASPRTWIQSCWIAETSCGTAGCFAGWTCLLSGDEPAHDEDGDLHQDFVLSDGTLLDIPVRAAKLLGIRPDGGPATGYRLFEPDNTRKDLGRIVAEIFGPRTPEHAPGALCPPPDGGAS